MGKIFSDIYGQKNAVAILAAQLESGNISHGYVFLGNQGTGKEYLATEFARYILCEKHTEDACENCQQFITGVHPDFIYIDGHDGIKIDMVREAVERINLSPNLAAKKVLFFSRAENLGIEAANALLKTLEEPPMDSVIIMTAVSEKSLPQTILSRVQKIKLSPIPETDIKKILSKEFTEEEIERVASFSAGSIGRAKNLIENPNEFQKVENLYLDAEKLIISKSVVERFKMLESYEKSKNLKELFDTFALYIFQAISARTSANPEERFVRIADLLGTSLLLAIAHKVLKIYADLDYNVNLRLTMEGIILEYLTND